jgi:hypothetical protein
VSLPLRVLWADIASLPFLPPAPGISYTPPVVLAITGAGAAGAPTAGGPVTISGRNFGPAALSAVGRVEYAPVGLPFVFTAACAVTVDDVLLQCNTSGGVGAALVWTVEVAGLLSSNARTGYARARHLSLHELA